MASSGEFKSYEEPSSAEADLFDKNLPVDTTSELGTRTMDDSLAQRIRTSPKRPHSTIENEITMNASIPIHDRSKEPRLGDDEHEAASVTAMACISHTRPRPPPNDSHTKLSTNSFDYLSKLLPTSFISLHKQSYDRRPRYLSRDRDPSKRISRLLAFRRLANRNRSSFKKALEFSKPETDLTLGETGHNNYLPPLEPVEQRLSPEPASTSICQIMFALQLKQRVIHVKLGEIHASMRSSEAIHETNKPTHLYRSRPHMYRPTPIRPKYKKRTYWPDLLRCIVGNRKKDRLIHRSRLVRMNITLRDAEVAVPWDPKITEPLLQPSKLSPSLFRHINACQAMTKKSADGVAPQVDFSKTVIRTLWKWVVANHEAMPDKLKYR
jgi:hypothetical protein